MLAAEVKEKIKPLKVEIDEEGIKFVLKKGKVSVARYLTRTLKLKDNGWEDHQIRDLASEIEVDLTPPKLIRCDTPEDYTEMYKAGYSCMSVGTYSHLGEVTRKIYETKKIWPTIWYHWIPNIQGYYVLHKGKPAARVFVLNNKFTGTMCGNTAAASKFMTDELAKLGYSVKSYRSSDYSDFYVKITEEVRIPGVEHDKQYWGPVPNCDNVTKGFGVTYDKETHDFIFGPTGKRIISNTYDWKGWISETACA